MAHKKKSNIIKVPMTLIIGLGGTGCDIVSQVNALTNPEQKKFVRFVFMDTDANELRERKEEAPYAYTVQTSKNNTVGQALRNDREARENTFPVNPQLLNKPLTEGAGQVRAISKLAFDSCLREGRMQPLQDAINDLLRLNGDNMEQAMRVVIVSTLVGGTGSGILLPLSMYLRHYLETHCQKKPLIRGFCVLPDVFFKNTNKPEVEKNNLRANAYATLRELDAFMLKSDSAFDADIRKRFTMKMPRPGTIDDYDEYEDSPMDYCFLFDGQNVDGDGLDTFNDYKQHAADCIYTSSISKLNKRLNSSEDNTILERCAASGRNRYCGIGTSKLIYPYNQLREYIALGWMEDVMTEDWLRYDIRYNKEVERRKIARSKGVTYPPVDKGEFYCSTIVGDGDQNVFSKNIIDECYDMDKAGVTRDKKRWELYYEALKEEIIKLAADGPSEYGGGVLEEINNYFSAMRSATDRFSDQNYRSAVVKLLPSMNTLYSLAKRYAEANARIFADSMFSPDNFNIKEKSHIEHWLVRDEVHLHPNSIRFFLYNLLALIKEELRQEKTSEDEKSGNDDDSDDDVERFADLKLAIEAFGEKNKMLESKSGDSKAVTLREFVTSSQFKIKRGAGSGMRKKPWADEAIDITAKCEKQFENINSYYVAYLRVKILEKAIEYITAMNNNYERFFDCLSDEIKRIPRKKERLKESFTNRSGSPIYYVCTSKKCLDGLLSNLQNTVDSVQLTPEFRKTLFDGMFGTMASDEKKRDSIIENIASNDILSFWCDSVSSARGNGISVNMNILGALLVEAEFEGNCDGLDDKVKYVEKKYNEAMKLAAPFIDRPAGKQPYYISACGLNNNVADTDDTSEAALTKLFENCERDPLLDKYQMLFLKTVYNLRVSDLIKFAPVDLNEVDPRGAGEYYKAYVSRINDVLPDSKVTKVLTPHLDKKWHYIGVLPDLDDNSEKEAIKNAQLAFFTSLVFNYVQWCQDQYKFKEENGDFTKDLIIVSDGKCDKMHEIYQAMLLSRPLIQTFIKRYKEMVERESNEKSIGNDSYKKSKLYCQIEGLKTHQYSSLGVISYLEIPLLMKVSMGNSEFKDDEAIVMMRNFIDFTDEYLRVFYTDEFQRREFYVDWLKDQVNRMIDNLTKYDSLGVLANPANDMLVVRMINNVIGILRPYVGMNEKFDQAYELIREKWNSFSPNNQIK